MGMVSVVVLNWNELHVVQASVERLMQEPEVETIVVDNGSIDGSVEWLLHTAKRQAYPTLSYALLRENTGSSIARNVGIEMAKGEDIFLLDGDILYVPGTIPVYREIMHYDPSYGCVGYNDHYMVQATGMNGTDDLAKAKTHMPLSVKLSKWFPMAWTQYGLFRGDMLRQLKFYSEGVFGTVGHGYEDDWLYHDMCENGYLSIAVNEPLYYHDGHYSLRLMQQMNLPNNGDLRGRAFYARWGEGNGWRERMPFIPENERVPFGQMKVTLDA